MLTDDFADCLLRRCSCEWHPNGEVQSVVAAAGEAGDSRLWLAKLRFFTTQREREKKEDDEEGWEEKEKDQQEAASKEAPLSDQ